MENNAKFLLETLTKITKESGCKENNELLLTQAFSSDIIETCMRNLTFAEAMVIEDLDSSASLAAVISVLPESAIKTLTDDLQHRIETLGFDGIVANVKEGYDAEVARDKAIIERNKQRAKLMGELNHNPTKPVANSMQVIFDKLEELNKLSLDTFAVSPISGPEFISQVIESTMRRYPNMKPLIKEKALEIHDLCTHELELGRITTGASDLTNSESGILVASLPNVKPRPKFVSAGIKDTKDGLVITFPKPLVFKLGTSHAINLGVSIPASTVEFKSEYLQCLAMSTSTMFGTVLLLQSRNVDTVKIDADGEIGILVHKNK